MQRQSVGWPAVPSCWWPQHQILLQPPLGSQLNPFAARTASLTPPPLVGVSQSLPTPSMFALPPLATVFPTSSLLPFMLAPARWWDVPGV